VIHSKTLAYAPLLPDIDHIGFNDIESLNSINDSVAAIVIEVIPAESGIHIPDERFLQDAQDQCKKYGVLLILDEIQSAMGRAGSLFAFTQYGLNPDILILGKSLGGGLPLAACISNSPYFETFASDPPLTHMTTFGGHPLSSAAGLAAWNILIHTDVIEQSKQMALRFLSKINHPAIKEIRSTQGLWMAIDLGDAELVQKVIVQTHADGLLLDWFLFNDHSIRIAPPLNITEADLDLACEYIDECIGPGHH
jgi:acetylornithine/succinyldiaminopimelate/putrescine aminotransferase